MPALFLTSAAGDGLNGDLSRPAIHTYYSPVRAPWIAVRAAIGLEQAGFPGERPIRHKRRQIRSWIRGFMAAEVA